MSTINPSYELPPEDTVEIDCETLDISGEIRSPTITQIQQSIDNHVNDFSKHRQSKVVEIVTDGASTFYTITHNLTTQNLAVIFFDVTATPQQLLFVHWEPISDNEIKIVPDVILPANRTIKILIQ
jgi:hypothetical protein